MLHRDRVTNIVEIECFISGGRTNSLLIVDVIKDGKKLGCVWITRVEAGKHSKSPSPSSLKLAEFIAGHLSFLLVKLRGGYGVPPMAYGWREPSHG